jgi:methionyl-tRNA formyltransferase
MALRLVFIVPDEPLAVPVFLRRVLPALGSRVVAIVVVRPLYRNATWVSQARRFARSFGIGALVAEGAGFVRAKALAMLDLLATTRTAHSVKGLAGAHGLPIYEPDDVNDPGFLAALRDLRPDLVISASCPQIFRQSLLELPGHGCINVHSSLLPHYRGVLPTFWAMANGESETGVTVHYMSPGVDEGGIIAQRRVAIGSDETLHSLMRACKAVAADLVIETVERFERGRVSATPNRIEEGTYFSFPRRQDVERFRALGRSLR